KEISEAYDVLSDEKKRKEYDEARTLFGGGGFRVPGGGGTPFDLSDSFGGSAGGGGLGDILGGIFGGRGGRTQASRRGADLEAEVTLAFTDAIDGATVPLQLSVQSTCPVCKGRGAHPGHATLAGPSAD